jgi:hypothetical protein
VISAYLEELAGTLSFDRALSRCVMREVEDHLCEAVAADPSRDRLEAERRAVANFGDPHMLAVQFAAVSLARQTRRVGIAVALAIVAVLATMKARVAWYAVVQWTLSEEVRPLGAIVLAIDRYAFWIAVVIGIGALLYIGRYCVPAIPRSTYSRHLRRAVLLCAVAASSLAVSVIADGVLTALQVGTDLCPQCVIPIVSMAVEIACAGAVIILILNTVRRVNAHQALLKNVSAPRSGAAV